MLHITGIAASAGLAVGPVKRINRASSGLTRVVLDPRREKALFEAAVLLAKDELAELEQRADQNDKDIFLFQRVMLDDQGLLEEIGQRISAGSGGAAKERATRHRAVDELLHGLFLFSSCGRLVTAAVPYPF